MMSNADIRFASGFDAHPIDADRPLYLCGVKISDRGGLSGHSDADVALHAIMDGILGITALGDIGLLFPPDDPQLMNIRSTELLERTLNHVVKSRPDFIIHYLDLTILCSYPVLSPFRDAMKASLAEFLNLYPGRISVKFGSCNGLGFVGKGEGMAAHAVLTASA